MSFSSLPPTGSSTPFISPISWATDGFEVGPQTSITKIDYATVLTGGAPTLLSPTPQWQTQQSALNNNATSPIVKQLRANEGPVTTSNTLRDVDGRVIVPNALGFLNLGSGHQMNFDPDTLAGIITPAFASTMMGDLGHTVDQGQLSYTGSDIRLIIEIPEPPKQGNAKARYAKQLIECTTISVSVHRAKAQVRAFGYINPKGFTRGTRTVAGTLILTQFTVEVLFRFLQAILFTNDKSKDTQYMKVDQLPPFNISMIFTNEQGFASYRRLIGVELVTDGTTYSIQDMFTEQTISFMCEDFTPLLPLDLSSLYNSPTTSDKSVVKEQTPLDKMHKYNKLRTA